VKSGFLSVKRHGADDALYFIRLGFDIFGQDRQTAAGHLDQRADVENAREALNGPA
jgi:hypothetical protein